MYFDDYWKVKLKMCQQTTASLLLLRFDFSPLDRLRSLIPCKNWYSVQLWSSYASMCTKMIWKGYLTCAMWYPISADVMDKPLHWHCYPMHNESKLMLHQCWWPHHHCWKGKRQWQFGVAEDACMLSRPSQWPSAERSVCSWAGYLIRMLISDWYSGHQCNR